MVLLAPQADELAEAGKIDADRGDEHHLQLKDWLAAQNRRDNGKRNFGFQ
jgi:hypothetical protein